MTKRGSSEWKDAIRRGVLEYREARSAGREGSREQLVCSECLQLLPPDAFYPSVTGRMRRMSQCKDCRKRLYDNTPGARAKRAAYMRKRRATDPEFVRRLKEQEKLPHRRWAKRDYQIRRQYGLEPEDMARMYDAQERQCPICGGFLDLRKLTSVDHCHDTGAVRGLLCNLCNMALGSLRENADSARRLVQYIEERCAPLKKIT